MKKIYKKPLFVFFLVLIIFSFGFIALKSVSAQTWQGPTASFPDGNPSVPIPSSVLSADQSDDPLTFSNYGEMLFSDNSNILFSGTPRNVLTLGVGHNIKLGSYNLITNSQGASFNGILTSLTGLKLNLGEGLEIISGGNDFYGTNLDARLIRMTDVNGTTVDGGLTFQGYGPLNESSDSVTRNIMTLRGNGNVGIGTIQPATPLHINGGNDVVVGTSNTGYLTIGSASGQHLAIDNNEIMSKSDGESTAGLYIQNEGGSTNFGGNIDMNNNDIVNINDLEVGTINGMSTDELGGGAWEEDGAYAYYEADNDRYLNVGYAPFNLPSTSATILGLSATTEPRDAGNVEGFALKASNIWLGSGSASNINIVGSTITFPGWATSGNIAEINSSTGLNLTGGDVGIGTDSPERKLDVRGSAYISESLRVDESLGVGVNNPAATLQVDSGGSQLFRVRTGTAPILHTKLLVMDNGGTSIGTYNTNPPQNGLLVAGNTQIGGLMDVAGNTRFQSRVGIGQATDSNYNLIVSGPTMIKNAPIYATTFYDYDNSSYYINPASGGNLGGDLNLNDNDLVNVDKINGQSAEDLGKKIPYSGSIGNAMVTCESSTEIGPSSFRCINPKARWIRGNGYLFYHSIDRHLTNLQTICMALGGIYPAGIEDMDESVNDYPYTRPDHSSGDSYYEWSEDSGNKSSWHRSDKRWFRTSSNFSISSVDCYYPHPLDEPSIPLNHTEAQECIYYHGGAMVDSNGTETQNEDNYSFCRITGDSCPSGWSQHGSPGWIETRDTFCGSVAHCGPYSSVDGQRWGNQEQADSGEVWEDPVALRNTLQCIEHETCYAAITKIGCTRD